MINEIRNYISKMRVRKMREKQTRIKHMVIGGWTVKGIAKHLNLSEEEVKFYYYL